MSARILVIGATGTTGRRVVERLGSFDVRVRAASRREGDAEAGSERVRFDWADPATYREAVRGVERAYLLAPALVEDPSAVMLPFLDEALRAGVRRVVLLSSSAIPEGAPGLGAVERALRERAPEWTILKPSWFMQNFVRPEMPHARSIAADGVMVTSTGDGRVPFVDAEDIAEVAVRALTDERAHDAAHVITGPAALRYDDVAEILSRVSGRPIVHLRVDDEEAVRRFAAFGMPRGYAALLVGLDAAIRAGAEDRVTDTVMRVTGRPPRSFEELAAAHAHVFARG